ncbi:alpha/beta hydrolase fold [Luteibacter sp. UNC138MFCol5.1]|nr:alpha/beta hydrolase fold [Luteibacter sp. UNC138MFCol5.1]
MWSVCPASLVESHWQHTFGPRLQCATMRVPLDYDEPGSREIEVTLIRVRARDSPTRQGALFVNFGGPGVSPLGMLPDLALLLRLSPSEQDANIDRQRIPREFDLVAVVPRGLPGSAPFTCPQPLPIPAWLDSTVYLADWNWAGFVRDTRTFAEGCTAEPMHRHMGTYEHIRDMERARIALGEPRLNFYGVSYGTYVGASYAATFPTTTGRIVLDSVMDYSGTFESQFARHAPARHGLFKRLALERAVANPAYGLGTDQEAIMRRLTNMPSRLQGPWQAKVDSPARLAATLTLADWARDDMAGWQTDDWQALGDRLLTRAGTHRFSNDTAIDGEIRAAAIALASPLRAGPGARSDLSAYYAVVCGDTPWRKDIGDLRTMANTIAATYPTGGGAPVTVGLICRHWQSTPRPAASMASLAQAPAMLMLQAEFDPATPLEGALNAFDVSPGSRLVAVRGMYGHGVFGMSATPCAEQSVARFLLTGVLPTERFSYCDYVPSPAVRARRDEGEERTLHEVREDLRARLADS